MAFKSAILHRQACMRSSVISATARLLVPGRLHTAMPRRFAASMSMVLTPLPIFWISFRLPAAAICAAVTGFSTCHSASICGRKRGELVLQTFGRIEAEQNFHAGEMVVCP